MASAIRKQSNRMKRKSKQSNLSKMWDTVKSIYKGMGEIDIAFFMIIMILLVMGIVMMFSASYAWAIDEGKAGSYYAQKQLMMAGAGLVAMLVLSVIPIFVYILFRKCFAKIKA